MDPLSLSASIVALGQLCSTIGKLALLVKHGRKDQSRLQQELTSIKIVLEQVEEARRKATDAFSGTIARLEEPSGPLDQLNALVCSLKAQIDVQAQSTMRWISWPLSQADVFATRDAIQRLKTIFIWAQVNDISSLNQSFSTDLHDLRDDVSSIKARLANTAACVEEVSTQVAQLQNRAQSQLEEKITEWLCPSEFAISQLDFEHQKATEYYEGTAKSLLAHSSFQAWASHTLQSCEAHIQGAPGSGKSVFLAHTALKLKLSRVSDDKVAVASAYCRYNALKQNPLLMLSHILQQIVRSSTGVFGKLVDLYEPHVRNGTRFQQGDVLALLEECAKMLDRAYIIVDALDECPDTMASTLVTSLRQRRLSNFKIMFSSRQAIPGVSLDLHDVRKINLLEVRATREDIEHYVRRRLEEDNIQCKAVQAQEELRSDIVEAITNKSQELFLLARLHVDNISRKPREKDIRKALNTLPHDLTATYRSALARIDHENQHLATQAFAWICLAREPLTAERLQYALAVSDCEDSEVGEADFWPIEFITNVCGGLVRIDSGGIVSLVHYSLKDHLLAHLKKVFPDVHDHLTDICLRTIISTKCSQTLEELVQRFGEQKFEHILQVVALDESAQLSRSMECGFVGYAVRNVAEHARRRSGRSSGHVLGKLFEDQIVFAAFRRLYAYLRSDLPAVHGDFSDCLIESFGPVHMSIWLRLLDLTSHLIDNGYDIHEFAYQGNNRVTPLFVAAYNNDTAAVRLLLNAGALVDIPSSMSLGACARQRWRYFQALTPLGIALLRGSIGAFESLLEHGATAVSCSSIDLKSMHLEDFSRLNEMLGTETRNVLPARHLEPKTNKHLGHASGSRSPLPLTPDTPFFEKHHLMNAPESPGIRVSAPASDPSEMLCTIRSLSNLDVRCSLPLFVIDMVESKQNVRQAPREEPLVITILKVLHNGLAPLMIAALRAKALDATALDASSNNALHTLAKRPGVSADNTAMIALLLIANGVSVGATNSRRLTALHIAAIYGSTGLAIHLIECGAEVDVLDRKGYSPLHYAAREGHEAIEIVIGKRLGDQDSSSSHYTGSKLQA